MNVSEMTAEQRQKEFLKVFRSFDSIGDGAEFVAKATGSNVGTVMVWRCKKRSGYAIPKRPFMMLMAAVEAQKATQKSKIKKK